MGKLDMGQCGPKVGGTASVVLQRVWYTTPQHGQASVSSLWQRKAASKRSNWATKRSGRPKCHSKAKPTNTWEACPMGNSKQHGGRTASKQATKTKCVRASRNGLGWTACGARRAVGTSGNAAGTRCRHGRWRGCAGRRCKGSSRLKHPARRPRHENAETNRECDPKKSKKSAGQQTCSASRVSTTSASVTKTKRRPSSEKRRTRITTGGDRERTERHRRRIEENRSGKEQIDGPTAEEEAQQRANMEQQMFQKIDATMQAMRAAMGTDDLTQGAKDHEKQYLEWKINNNKKG